MSAADVGDVARTGTSDPGSAGSRRYRAPHRELIRGLTRVPPADLVLGLGLVALLLVAVAGPWVVPQDPTSVVGPPSNPPDGQFWAGTDQSGLDVFSRTVVATRVDVLIAAAVAVLATAAGVVIGLGVAMNESRPSVAGFAARAGARFLDLLEAVPTIVVGLVAVSFFGVTRPTLILALALIVTPMQARLVRTEALRVRSEAYLDAARQAGLGEVRLIVRHVLPNSVVPALQNASVLFGFAIILVAALGFLGVGLPPPTPEWGSMITDGAGDASTGRFWAAGFPAVALCLTVALISVLGARLSGTRRR